MRLSACTDIVLVANQYMRAPASRYIHCLRVAAGFDAADRHIASQVVAGDVVITADIPLAAAVVAKGAVALGPRGRLYTENNIAQCLSLRDFMAGLRDSGMVANGGHAAYSQADIRAFANQLDKLLALRNRP